MGEIRRPKRNLFKKYFENFLPFTFRRSFEADLRISLFWGIKKAGSEDPASIRQIGIYLSVSINTALHGEPSVPDKFSGAAFRK